MQASTGALKLLDREFLGIRSKLIDLAATLDRIQRGAEAGSYDPRMDKIIQAANILAGQSPDRAKQIQMLFSLPYEENWQK
jgi:hypothetical protein